MNRATLYAVAWLVFTVGILIFHVGCGGSQAKPSTVKPAPKQMDEVSLTCFRVERGEAAEAYFCSSEKLCKAAHARMVAFWEPLSEKYGATGLSDCLAVDVLFTQR